MFSVDVATGAVQIHSVDLGLPGYIPLEVSRTYRSGTKTRGLMGPGWTFNLDVFLCQRHRRRHCAGKAEVNQFDPVV